MYEGALWSQSAGGELTQLSGYPMVATYGSANAAILKTNHLPLSLSTTFLLLLVISLLMPIPVNRWLWHHRRAAQHLPYTIKLLCMVCMVLKNNMICKATALLELYTELLYCILLCFKDIQPYVIEFDALCAL
jgi:hypothetical protein